VISDALGTWVTDPVSSTAIGLVTHYANIVPRKVGPRVVGAGQVMTYTISAYNRGMSTNDPPILTDVVPLSTTFVRASHGGMTTTISDTRIVSWTLPLLSPGDGVQRQFAVRVDEDLVSGTQIFNREYAVFGYGNVVTDAVTSGPPVTTTVREVGLIDSYKRVWPVTSRPASNVVLTYAVHIVNSGPLSLTAVSVYDFLPWEDTTYRRDATVSAGTVLSDIVSVRWTGDVAPFSSEVVTVSVRVDPGYQGPVTNTAVISHPDLRTPVYVDAVAYVTTEPVLQITKSASPDPVARDEELGYAIHVVNRGQQATGLVITDSLPANVTYIPDSATGTGRRVEDEVRWDVPVLKPGEGRTFGFRVTIDSGRQVVNDQYGVRCAEGVTALGTPLTTQVSGGGWVYLPLALRSWP
jgi:uncharacterized repeat protein (TIGR01451 family)